RWTSWGTAYAGAGSFAGHAALGSSGLSTRAAGIAAGADYRVDAGTLVGFAISGTSLNYGLGGFGSGKGEAFKVGLYASTRL
ncbi:autotransporter domain-containing protein, partial [Acinetobacter baumannii]|uniref:autotransporter domain-containing protein n=1 Tax=Acinetobacter baumannii TaxID=470 RepID=UPI0013D6FCA3